MTSTAPMKSWIIRVLIFWCALQLISGVFQLLMLQTAQSWIFMTMWNAGYAFQRVLMTFFAVLLGCANHRPKMLMALILLVALSPVIEQVMWLVLSISQEIGLYNFGVDTLPLDRLLSYLNEQFFERWYSTLLKILCLCVLSRLMMVRIVYDYDSIPVPARRFSIKEVGALTAAIAVCLGLSRLQFYVLSGPPAGSALRSPETYFLATAFSALAESFMLAVIVWAGMQPPQWKRYVAVLLILLVKPMVTIVVSAMTIWEKSFAEMASSFVNAFPYHLFTSVALLVILTMGRRLGFVLAKAGVNSVKMRRSN